MYNAIYYKGDSYYGPEIKGFFFVSPVTLADEKTMSEIKEYLLERYGWYERAGKHSYTEVESAEVLENIDILEIEDETLWESRDTAEYLYEDFLVDVYGKMRASELFDFHSNAVRQVEEAKKKKITIVPSSPEAVSKDKLSLLLATQGWKVCSEVDKNQKLTAGNLIEFLSQLPTETEILIEDSDGGSSHGLTLNDVYDISDSSEKRVLLTIYKEEDLKK